DLTHWGVEMARKGRVPAGRVLNALTLSRLLHHLKRRKNIQARARHRRRFAMPALETLKKITETATGWARPGAGQLTKLLRPRKPLTYRFRDDGIIPNHARWPLVIYRGAVRRDDAFDPAAVFEQLFERNGWGDSWRDGIYDYVHYHSRIHEVLGIARGQGKVQFGGLKGRTI